MIADNYRVSIINGIVVVGTDASQTNPSELFAKICVEAFPVSIYPIKQKLSQQEKRQMFKIANEKHSRRPR